VGLTRTFGRANALRIPKLWVGDVAANVDVTRRILLAGTYPPTRCGIASFTWDLRGTLLAQSSAHVCDVIAIDPSTGPCSFENGVVLVINPTHPDEYASAVEFVGRDAPHTLCVQHEFGIFGGVAGSNILALIEAVSCPVASVLHTVLEFPSANETRVFERIISASDLLIVMSQAARQILVDRWRVEQEKIAVIPHGRPEAAAAADGAHTEITKDWPEREVLLSFGLLSPDKGVSSVIEAMPAVLAVRPHALYVVAGVTHPNLVASEGERHRNELCDLVRTLGVGASVRFVDEYLSTEDLAACIQAADICMTPYANAAQVTSGTLAYAVGLGCPVISTAFLHATELLKEGEGRIVPFGDCAAIATSVLDLLQSGRKGPERKQNASSQQETPTWRQLGQAYLEAFDFASARRAVRQMHHNGVSVSGLRRLTDDCGMLQHSLFDVPNRHHGYCLDDNARALVLMHRMPGPPENGCGSFEPMPRSWSTRGRTTRGAFGTS
jgi:glycosyltransferase involved in cell wall biosynthesis